MWLYCRVLFLETIIYFLLYTVEGTWCLYLMFDICYRSNLYLARDSARQLNAVELLDQQTIAYKYIILQNLRFPSLGICCSTDECLPGVLGEQGKRWICSGKTGAKQENHRNTKYMGEHGNKAYFRERIRTLS